MTQTPQQLSETIDTPSNELRLGNITEEGHQLIQDFLSRLADYGKGLPRDPDFFDGLQHWYASGGRIIVEFPDEHIKQQYVDSPYDTTYVVKLTAHNSPDVEIFKEITAWKELHDHEVLSDHLAPVDAWGENCQWVLMRRVWAPTDMSDRADNAQRVEEITQQIMQDGFDRQIMEEFMAEGDPHEEIPPSALYVEDIEALFEEHGWNIQDADENTGYDHISEHTCLYDFGGVEPLSADEDGYYKEYREIKKEFEMPGTQGELDRFT